MAERIPRIILSIDIWYNCPSINFYLYILIPFITLYYIKLNRAKRKSILSFFIGVFNSYEDYKIATIKSNLARRRGNKNFHCNLISVIGSLSDQTQSYLGSTDVAVVLFISSLFDIHWYECKGQINLNHSKYFAITNFVDKWNFGTL